MTSQEIRSKLEEHREELATMGIASLALFGSVARGESGSASDVDFLSILEGVREGGDQADGIGPEALRTAGRGGL